MKDGKFWRSLDAWRDKFDPVVNQLSFQVGKSECHLLIDDKMDRGLGIVRGKGREFVLRDGQRFHEPNEIRQDVRNVHSGNDSHLALAWNKFSLSSRRHAFVGNGNLLSNPHFVAYKVESQDRKRLFALATEPYSERIYSCLVVWEDFKITIEDLQFSARESNGFIEVEYIRRTDDPEHKDIKDHILYATYGQRLVKDREPVFPEDIDLANEFYDSRHVILNPYYQGRYDFGMDQLMANPELYERALRGEVITLDTRIMRERISLYDLRKALAGKDYYEGEPVPGVSGVYRLSPDGKTLDMTMHLGLYPHNTIGIWENEGKTYVYVVQFPGLSNRAGVGISKMSQYLAVERKFKDAILLDNGGDVIMYHRKQADQADFPGPDGYHVVRGPSEKDRIKMNSILLFVATDKDIEISSVSLP